MAPDLLPSSSTHRSWLRRTSELAGALSYDYPPSSHHSNTFTVATSNDVHVEYDSDKRHSRKRASRSGGGVDAPASPSSSAGSSCTSHNHQHPTRHHTSLQINAREAISPYPRRLNSKSKRLNTVKVKQESSYDECLPSETSLPPWNNNISGITSTRTASSISLHGPVAGSPSSAEMPSFSRSYSPGESLNAPEPPFGSPLSQSEPGYPPFDETVQSGSGEDPYSPVYGSKNSGEGVASLPPPENEDEEDRGGSPAPFDNAIDGQEFAWLDDDGNKEFKSGHSSSEEGRADKSGHILNPSIRSPSRQAWPHSSLPYKPLRSPSPVNSVPQALSGITTHTMTVAYSNSMSHVAPVRIPPTHTSLAVARTQDDIGPAPKPQYPVGPHLLNWQRTYEVAVQPLPRTSISSISSSPPLTTHASYSSAPSGHPPQLGARQQEQNQQQYPRSLSPQARSSLDSGMYPIYAHPDQQRVGAWDRNPITPSTIVIAPSQFHPREVVPALPRPTNLPSFPSTSHAPYANDPRSLNPRAPPMIQPLVAVPIPSTYTSRGGSVARRAPPDRST